MFDSKLNAILADSGIHLTIDKLDRKEQRKMVAAFVAMAQQQQEAEPEPPEAAAPELPVIPDGVLDQILANALALQALNAMLREADIDETIGQLDREAQRKAVAAFILMAWQQQEAKAAGGAGPEFPEVSDDLVLFIFAEARLQDQLRDIMRQLNLSGEPGNLPFETKRAVVAALMEQSEGQARGARQAKAPADAGKKGSSWWPFWRKH